MTVGAGSTLSRPKPDDARPTILVVDDESIVVDMIRRYLLREGFHVFTATSGPAAVSAALDPAHRPSLIVLDVMLPGLDGFAICDRLRRGAGATMPIILLTARGDDADRIRGLNVGADDYVVKPFSPGELVARVKAQLRRVKLDTQTPRPDGRLCGGDIVLDPRRRTCEARGEPIGLTPKEFDVLHRLMLHAGRTLSRDELLDTVWDRSYVGDPSTVTVHVRRLREKVELDPERPMYIKTIWGLGYKFHPSASE